MTMSAAIRNMALAACVLGVSAGLAEAREMKVVRKTLDPVATAPAEPIAVRDVTPDKLKTTLDAAGAALEESSVCTRKVKVIYSGYGEADRAACQAATVKPVSAEGKTVPANTSASSTATAIQ